MIEKLNGIKKIFSSYFHEFLIQLEARENSETLVSLFGLFAKTKENFELKQNSINNFGMTDKEIFEFLEIYFFDNNLNLFDEFYAPNHTTSNTKLNLTFDNIEKLFMILNDYLFTILGNMDCFVVLEDNSIQRVISWSVEGNDYSSYFKYLNDCLYKNSGEIFNREIFPLESNKKIYFYYRKSDYYKTKNYKDLILLYFNLTKNLYLHHFNRLISIDSNDINGIGWSNGDFAIDREQYSKKNILRVFPYDNKKEINILHISDLHLKKCAENNNFANKFLRKFYENECQNIINESDKKTFKNIDVIVITGDTINAGYSTQEILDNYLYAFDEIQVIGKVLLGNLWTKRIFVIPGNHDYGMINETKIQIKDRALIGSGVLPTTEEFKKFVFFHFIFGDKSLNKTIFKIENHKQSLDTVRINYQPEKYLSFYLFNTACDANTELSNEVSIHLDDDFVPPQLHSDNNNSKDYFIFLLMHHTPLFEINYYRDKFDGKYFDYGSLILGFESSDFKEILNAIYSKSLENVKKIYNEHDAGIKEKLQLTSSNEVIEVLENIKKCNKELMSELEKQIETSLLLSKFKKSQQDQKKYNERITTIMKEISYLDYHQENNCLIMGGHFHNQRYKEYDKYRVLEVGNTILKNKETNEEKFYYAIVNIIIKDNCMKIYSSVPMKKNQKKDDFIEKK